MMTRKKMSICTPKSKLFVIMVPIDIIGEEDSAAAPDEVCPAGEFSTTPSAGEVSRSISK